MSDIKESIGAESESGLQPIQVGIDSDSDVEDVNLNDAGTGEFDVELGESGENKQSFIQDQFDLNVKKVEAAITASNITLGNISDLPRLILPGMVAAAKMKLGGSAKREVVLQALEKIVSSGALYTVADKLKTSFLKLSSSMVLLCKTVIPTMIDMVYDANVGKYEDGFGDEQPVKLGKAVPVSVSASSSSTGPPGWLAKLLCCKK
jgi:hypothetical protein